MKAPSNYEKTEAFAGSGQRLTPGGKICTIINAYETKAKSSGRPMLAIEFDILEGSEAGYYRELFGKYKGNWKGVYRQNTEDAEGNCSPFFKGMISSIEESNDRYKFDFNEKTLVGKRFGGIFGEEEYIANDGEVKTSVKLLSIRSVETIRSGDFAVPPKKLIAPSTTRQVDSSGFADISSDDIPF